jgi:hypothetical protein
MIVAGKKKWNSGSAWKEIRNILTVSRKKERE